MADKEPWKREEDDEEEEVDEAVSTLTPGNSHH